MAFSPLKSERFSAIIQDDVAHKVYSNNLIKTTVEGAYDIAKHISLKAEAGYIYYHKVKLLDRSSKSFWSNMFSNKNAYKYQPSVSFLLGLQYRM